MVFVDLGNLAQRFGFFATAAGLGALCGGSCVDKIRLTFDLFDRDRDGYLDEFEIRAYLASVYKVSAHDLVNNDTGEPVSADELAAATAAAILEEADSDGDGRVSFDEFARWVSSEHVEELPGDEETEDDDETRADEMGPEKKKAKIDKKQIASHYARLQEYHTQQNTKIPQEYVELFATHLDAGTP